MNKEELVAYLLDNPSLVNYYKQKRVSKKFNLEYEFVNECFKEVRIQLEKSKDINKDAQSFSDRGGQRLLEYLKEHNLRLSDVQRIKIYGDTEDPMFSIHTKDEWYKQQEDFIDKLLKSIKDYQIPTFTPKNLHKGDSCAVLNLYDAHIDRLVLIDETNPSGNIDDNIIAFEDAFDKLLSQTLIYSPEYIIFPVGNDFFNSNDMRNTTKKGTPQDTNPFWKQSFTKGFECIRRCIDKAAQYAQVFVYLVISNHDEDKLFYFGQMLAAIYENAPHVFVENSTRARKYLQYGNTLLGFSHGDKEKNYINSLPATIMYENKKIMPDVDFIHHFCGDIHHKETHLMRNTMDLKGCQITFLRSLADESKWEYEQGYVGIPKTAEAYIFKKGKGLAANLQVHI